MAPSKSPPASDAPASGSSKSEDVALVHRVTPEGEVHILRKRGEQLEAGALSPLREGAPIQGEVVTLHPRPSFPLLCDVQVHYAPPSSQKADRPAPVKAKKGPAQVASDEYRSNWDNIWKAKKSESLN